MERSPHELADQLDEIRRRTNADARLAMALGAYELAHELDRCATIAGMWARLLRDLDRL